jgi:ubiquinone/menaquinone biosynthesis C-methylase UbiE
VQAVYEGPEGKLWELIMGEQIHIGGMASSMDLAAQAGIFPGSRGVDLCCCTGAGMRFLLRFAKVEAMMGVDATAAMIEKGRFRCRQEGFDDRIEFTLADACQSGLPSAQADFVWGEDAWCYVVDKPRLIAEAVRLVKPGGTIAFTDWLEGPGTLSDAEADRFLRFMKFPSIETLQGYQELLKANGCEDVWAADTGRFAPCIDLYMSMLALQHTYDTLKIIGFDQAMMRDLGVEMAFVQSLAKAGKVCQGLFVADKMNGGYRVTRLV